MGEIYFCFNTGTENGQENNFTYMHSDKEEHKISYHRTHAVIHADLFNRPVAVTKMAAGLSDLKSLFNVSCHAQGEVYSNDAHNMEKHAGKSIVNKIYAAGNNDYGRYDGITHASVFNTCNGNDIYTAKKQWSTGIFKAIPVKHFINMHIYGNINTLHVTDILHMPWGQTQAEHCINTEILPACTADTSIKAMELYHGAPLYAHTCSMDLLGYILFKQNRLTMEFFQNTYMYRSHTAMRIINNSMLQQNCNGMEIMHNMDIGTNINSMEILQSMVNTSIPGSAFSIYGNINTYCKDDALHVMYQYHASMPRNMFSLYKGLSAGAGANPMDVHSTLPVSSTCGLFTVYQDIYLHKQGNILNIIKNMAADSSIDHAVIGPWHNARYRMPAANTYMQAAFRMHGRMLNKYISSLHSKHDSIAVKEAIYNAQKNNGINKAHDISGSMAWHSQYPGNAYCGITYMFKHYGKPSYAFDIGTFCIEESHYGIYTKDTIGRKHMAQQSYIGSYAGLYKDNLYAGVNNDACSALKHFAETEYGKQFAFNDKHMPYDITEHNIVSFLRSTGTKAYTDSTKFSACNNRKRKINTGMQVSFNSIYKNFRLMKDNIAISSAIRHMAQYAGMVRTNMNGTGVYAEVQVAMFCNLTDVWLSGSMLWTDIKSGHIIIHPDMHDMAKQDINTSILLLPWDMSDGDTSMDLIWQEAIMEHEENCLNMFRNVHDIKKRITGIQDSVNMEYISKKAISTVFTNHVDMPPFEYIYGMVVPVSRASNNHLYTEHIDNMVCKEYSHGVHISRDIFTDTIHGKNIPSADILFADSRAYAGMMLDIAEELVIKSTVHNIVHGSQGMHIHKDGHSINGNSNDNFVYKDGKAITAIQLLCAWKDATDICIAYSCNVYKGRKNMSLFIDEFITKDSHASVSHVTGVQAWKYKNMEIFNDWFIKHFTMTWYDYGVWAKNHSYIDILGNDIPAAGHKDIIINFAAEAQKKAKNCFEYFTIYADKKEKPAPLKQAMEWVDKVRKKCGIHKDDFGNWAWVYETPDPFYGDPYGIDELLLPENDVRYENFEDIIFDKEHMRPKNPVKQIDNTTFIAKYPIRHPSPGFNDIAVNYDDSAMKINNYFGIKTSIVKEIFLKYYRIWQAKLFEFSTMTMAQAVNAMLEYMYVWIMDFFPPEYIEQALRVLKLIRWYGESAIIQNSQYIISFEYDTLESKLSSGTCAVPNSLDVNDTMVIDAHLGVIKVNPVYVGSSTDVYVDFYINNKTNTTFTFSLSNTVGSVNIYINGVLAGTRPSSAINITYPVKYTGHVNVVRIEKKASHNLNSTFFIGNIKIPQCAFKDLKIDFDPQLRNGNKPLNDVAMKIVAYANMREDMEEAYNVAMKANLGVSEVYKMMVDYWNIHHKNQVKGKRLTIKEL